MAAILEQDELLKGHEGFDFDMFLDKVM